ncbi:MAG: hypothetical protein ACOCVI_03180 [Planctomycetota bacterium]
MHRALIDVVFHPDRRENHPRSEKIGKDRPVKDRSISRREDIPWRVMEHDVHNVH